ncbi:MAG: putative oxidoreductase C-terminal domain-containing protein [Bacteroidales bacterium]|jgi:predicted dehydrogenase|nr:putative oxidoreductase C-terminal domain-containing protein [Bacteroidales bacterium]
MRKYNYLLATMIIVLIGACGNNKNNDDSQMKQFTLMTLDPGHFHAALVQKNMYDDVSPVAYVYGPEGDDLDQHMERIDAFNQRDDNPTGWEEMVYTGSDFFEHMLEKRPGNVVILAGNNRKKTDYIIESLRAGLNVLADKPMLITPEKFPVLEEAFRVAEENNILLYDIMTERYEITTMLQKALSQNSRIFGKLETGSADQAAVTKESVHHFFKYVSGKPVQRAGWYFDTRQQGEGIVDVTTHLVDLIQWECYPEVILDKEDIEIIEARRWPTVISPGEFREVSGLEEFPGYLEKDIIDGNLHVYANGEIVYKIKDTWARVVVEWKFRAPGGTGDTHYSIMRGTKSDLVIRQGEEEGYVPELYIEVHRPSPGFTSLLDSTLSQLPWEGITCTRVSDETWKLIIPDKYRVGHEAHFGQVMEKYLDYLEKGEMPEWEVPNMIVKYYTTTEALRKALEGTTK